MKLESEKKLNENISKYNKLTEYDDNEQNEKLKFITKRRGRKIKESDNKINEENFSNEYITLTDEELKRILPNLSIVARSLPSDKSIKDLTLIFSLMLLFILLSSFNFSSFKILTAISNPLNILKESASFNTKYFNNLR